MMFLASFCLGCAGGKTFEGSKPPENAAKSDKIQGFGGRDNTGRPIFRAMPNGELTSSPSQGQ